jgi:primosomal protein N' (replication factor Y)
VRVSNSTAAETSQQSKPHETATQAAFYAEVAVPLHVFQTFTYRLSPEDSAQAQVGARVVVPLGRNLVTGYILALLDELPDTLAEVNIKDAQSLVDSLPVCSPEILGLAAWVADYYACPIGEVIKAALPPGMTPSISQSKATSYVKPKLRRFVRRTETNTEKLTAAQQRVISTLETDGPMLLQSLLKIASVSASTVSSLEKKALVDVYDEAVRRDPLAQTPHLASEVPNPTPAQLSALEQIEQQMNSATYSTFLLHGVTGSGKTEIYMRAMQKALSLGRSAMMLVPEIALTPVFSRGLRARFGDQVAIFHSSLQKGERFDEWTRVKNGDARVVIGTRSAVFAPVKNLGLIVVDEEHESSYRQQESPYYNARDVAIVRAQKESATVVLGSATPSLESFHNARKGKYQLLNLPERIAARPMATAKIVDMRNVFARHGKPKVFSDELLEAIRETRERNEQSIILLNRRGYSSFILCRSCGETVQCPNCDVTLTYHRSERVIVCHYCNHRAPVPPVCPSCGKKYIYYVGEGTEQLEEMLKLLFPSLRVARIDRDTTARRRVFEQSLADFSAGHACGNPDAG